MNDVQGVGYARKPPVYLHDGDKIHIEIEKLGFIEHKVYGDLLLF